VSRHQANILLSTRRALPEEEEEAGADGGATVPERVDGGVAEDEGISRMRIGLAGN
jgi:hypothetical protein